MSGAAPEDDDSLMHLLDEGWFQKKATHRQGSARSSRPSSAQSTSSQGDAADRSGSIPAVRPAVRTLDLTALRDHRSHDQLYSSRSTFSTGVATPMWDTPRSWVTAASLASTLPQTPAEINSLDSEEVARLADEAADLEKRAKKALQLARARLQSMGDGGGNEHSSNDDSFIASLAGQCLLQVAVPCLAVVFLGIAVLQAVLGALMCILGLQRGEPRTYNGPLHAVYAASGSVAGAVSAARAVARKK